MDKMITNWLDEHNVEYDIASADARNEYLTIAIEPKRLDKNSLEEPSKFKKEVVIHYNEHFGYCVHHYKKRFFVDTVDADRDIDLVIDTLSKILKQSKK